MPLIDQNESVLVVIDLQPLFWGDRLDAGDRRCVADVSARAAWLAAAATAPAHRRSFMPSWVAAKPSLS